MKLFNRSTILKAFSTKGSLENNILSKKRNICTELPGFANSILYFIRKSIGIFFLFASYFCVQASSIDSLSHDLLQLPDSKEKADTLWRIGLKYQGKDFELSNEYANSSLAIAESIDYIVGQSNAYSLLGQNAIFAGRLDEGLVLIYKNIDYAKLSKNKNQQLRAANNLGAALLEKNNYEQALIAFQDALDIAHEINDIKYYSLISSNIALIHKHNGNVELETQYYKLAADIAFKAQDSILLLKAHEFMGHYHNLNKSFEASIESYKKALEISEKTNYYTYYSVISTALAGNLMELGKFQEALQYANKSLKQAESSDFKYMIAYTRNFMGRINLELDVFDQAIQNSNIAIQIAIDNKFTEIEKDGLEIQADAYKSIGDYQNAFKSLEKCQIVKDSIFTKDQRVLVGDLEAKYKNAQQEKEIVLKDSKLALLNEKNTKIQFIFLSILIGVISLITIGFYKVRLSNFRKIDTLKQELAMNFHDNTANTINGINRIAQMIQEKKLRGADLEKEVTRISTLSGDALTSISDIIWSLKNEEVSVQELVIKLKEFVNESTDIGEVPFSLQVDPKVDTDKRLDSNTRHQLLMIFKEAIMNALKHSYPTSITANISPGKSIFNIQIINSFNEKRASNYSSGLGLDGIKKRVSLLKGEVSIEEKINDFRLMINI